MLDRDWLDGLIENTPSSFGDGHRSGDWFRGANDLRDAILAVVPPEPTNEICFECGCEIRDDYGFVIPTDIGAHSQDITESPICAICWCRSWRPCPHHGDLCDAQRRYGPRIAVPEPEPSPQITREWINEKMNEVAACVRGGVSLSWADGWAACRAQVLSEIESLRAAAPEPPSATAPRECSYGKLGVEDGEERAHKIWAVNFKFCPDCGAALDDKGER